MVYHGEKAKKLRILEVGGSGTIFTNKCGPVSNVISCLSKSLYDLGHNITIVDVNNNSVNRMFLLELSF